MTVLLLAVSLRVEKFQAVAVVHSLEMVHHWSSIGSCCLLGRRNLPFVSASLVGSAVMMCRSLWLALLRIFEWIVDIWIAAIDDDESSG